MGTVDKFQGHEADAVLISTATSSGKYLPVSSSPARTASTSPCRERESVYEADVLLQGLANLRPQRVMGLLKACTSVKVKRLFLALSERHGHAWFKHLDPSKLDLGRGKRMLVPGGKLHPKYLVTLPADLDAHAR